MKPPAGEATKQRARELRQEGLSWQRIAAEVGYGKTIVQRWCDPAFDQREKERKKAYQAANAVANREYRRRWREKHPTYNARMSKRWRRELAALKEQRQLRELDAKDPLAEAYGHLRQAAQALDVSGREGRAVLVALYEVEDHLARIIRQRLDVGHSPVEAHHAAERRTAT